MRVKEVRNALFWGFVGGTSIVLAGMSVQATPAPDPSAQVTSGQTVPANGLSPQRTLLNQYCVTCHNEKIKTGGLALDKDSLDVQRIGERADVWEKVVRKLRGDAMPPAGRPRPDRAAYDTFISWLEHELDRAALAKPNPGRTEAFHRLNRTEYQNAIRDLLAVEGLDMRSLLPADDLSYGFDNIAGVLKLSPTLLERYVSAARRVSRIAIGDPSMSPDSTTYRVSAELSQLDRFDNLPMGTRGGALIRHYFPMSGDYVIKVVLDGLANVLEMPDQLEVGIDGERVKIFTVDLAEPGTENTGPYGAIPKPLELRLPVTAGRHDVSVTFVKITSAEIEGLLQPHIKPWGGVTLMPVVRSVSVAGPYAVTGLPDTPSRNRIFVCRPATPAQESSCAKQIISTLARRAYRRPVTPEDVRTLMSFYYAGREEGDFGQGVQRAIERVLVSPAFLFRVEREPADAVSGTPYRLTDLELASRLSFFLWSSIPDDELLEVAARGRLKDPAVLNQQAVRMLASPKATALTTNFVGQWLMLRNLDATLPDQVGFPDFDDGLRQSLRVETERVFDSILREGASALALLNADYTFVNERLAKHYGIPNVYGSHFRRVTITENARRGILGHGSILTVTSYADRTSPVVRGKWLLDNILGSSPPPPPPDVPALATRTEAGKALTMREAMVQHRANPVCASCHSQMDPLGFALENFDAVGRWRTRSQGSLIDATGALPNGKTFDGVVGLREVLLSQPERFVTTLTEKLLTYGLGRGVQYYDMPAIRRIVHETAPDNYRLSSLILGIVKSAPFQMRRAES